MNVRGEEKKEFKRSSGERVQESLLVEPTATRRSSIKN